MLVVAMEMCAIHDTCRPEILKQKTTGRPVWKATTIWIERDPVRKGAYVNRSRGDFFPRQSGAALSTSCTKYTLVDVLLKSCMPRGGVNCVVYSDRIGRGSTVHCL